MVTELIRYQDYLKTLDTANDDAFVEAAEDMWLVTRLAQVLNKEEAAQALHSIDIWTYDEGAVQDEESAETLFSYEPYVDYDPHYVYDAEDDEDECAEVADVFRLTGMTYDPEFLPKIPDLSICEFCSLSINLCTCLDTVEF